MKHLEETPWWICDKNDQNFIAYSDTDSIYVHAEPLLRHLYPNFDKMDPQEKDNILEEIALKYQDIVTNSYDNLAKECFNVPEHRLEMKTECVIRSAYFRATRRYAQWITKQEGITKESLDIKGLEFKKANFPPVLGDFFKNMLVDILKGAKQKDIDFQIKDFKNRILTGNIPIFDLGNPTSVKTLNKYIERKAKSGEIFSIPAKGAPAPVKAAIVYNDLIKFWKLDGKHNYITQGDKIKWVYLKPNSYQISEIAFLDFDMPEKIYKFIEENIDRNKIFEAILLNKLENFYDDLGWRLNLNPFKDMFFNI